MGARMRAFDWAKTPLGAGAMASISKDHRSGDARLALCDVDAVGRRVHPLLQRRVLAHRGHQRIWPDIAPRIARVLELGQATWDEGLLLFLERSGLPEATYHTFSYSPVYNDASRIGWEMLCVVRR